MNKRILGWYSVRGARFISTLLASLLPLAVAHAQSPAQPRAPGIESPGYVWNVVENEELRALRLNANLQRGSEAYRVCHGCHRAGGVGTTDGVYPRLAGQHDTFLIKQLVDIRAGRRDNPKMYPFANEHAISTQDIADLAAWLNAQPSSPDNGTGDGKQLVRGEALFGKDCANCHGRRGEGQADMFYPRVGRQHFAYLLQESRDIRDGKRRNANPKMVEAIRSYADADLSAVADYMARLSGEAQPTPARPGAGRP